MIVSHVINLSWIGVILSVILTFAIVHLAPVWLDVEAEVIAADEFLIEVTYFGIEQMKK